MISISLYHQYTRNIATALGIGYVLAVDDEQVTAQIPDSADPVLVAIIPSDDTADSPTADNMSEASTSLLFIVSPIKADTDTAEFFARHQLLTEKCKKLMMLYADAYPSLLGIKENRISSDPITGQFSGNMAGYILSFSLSNPATFYAETVPDIPGIDPASAYIEIADVVGLLEALAGKAPLSHHHPTSEIDEFDIILQPLQDAVEDIATRVTQAETDIAGKAPSMHRHATSDIDNLTEILDPLQQDVADIDARITQAESEIAGKAPSMHRHATSEIDNLPEILTPLQQEVADIDARVTHAETDIAGKAPSQHRHPTSEIDNLPEILDPLQQDVADIDARVTQAEADINATEAVVALYPSAPVASKMLVARADGTGYEHTAFRADQVLQTSAVDVSDPTWIEQEERLCTIKKNNGVASFDGSAKLVDNFLPPSVLATLENSDAGWVNETKILYGDNSTFALGQSGSSGWFSDGSFVQCLTATYTVAGSATFRRNRATDVLNRNDSQDALVINQLDPSYTYPAMIPTGVSTDLGWDTITQIKAINNTTYPARLGTWFIGGINGTGYRYDCYAIEGNTSYWKRSGMPEAVIVRITAASHPTLTGRLVAKSDWATSAYTQQAGDEATYVDGYYYHAASRSMYRKVDFTIWEKI